MALTLWIVLFLSLLLFLAAAKTHGRQIRLERELRGHMDIQFGTGTNPPFVEGLWRRDRIRFWSLFAVLAALFLVLALVPIVPSSALPLHRATEERALARSLIGALLWAPTITFLTLAVLSLRRFRHDEKNPTPDEPNVHHPPPWRIHARRSTLFWFATAFVLLTLVIVLAYR